MRGRNLERSFKYSMGWWLAGFVACFLLAGAVHAAGKNVISLGVGEGKVVRADEAYRVAIANPGIADLQEISPNAFFLVGKKIGQTNILMLDDDGGEHGSVVVKVHEGGGEATASSLKDARGDDAIRLVAQGDRVVIRGATGNVDKALMTRAMTNGMVSDPKKVEDQSTLSGTNQINIRVRFVEVQKDELRQYGVSWRGAINNGSFSLGFLTSGTMATNPGSNSGILGGDFVDGLLQALETNDMLQVLAEPNITAVSGQTASFLAGGEIPIPIPVHDDVVGVEYKQYGVSLLTTPTLLPNGRISMQVRPEVSSLAPNSESQIGPYNLPGINVRRADTTVEIGSGQTFAIGGLFRRDDTRSMERIPLLGQLPIIGNLFRSQRFQRNQTELVILITPYLVTPSSDQAHTPLDKGQMDRGRTLRPITMEHNDDFGFKMQ